MKVSYSYLQEQFNEPINILEQIRNLVKSGDLTLGKPTLEFEEKFANLCQTDYAIGVGSGTDALRLSLISLGISAGDEVITTPLTFFATIGAIVTAGAKPIFVDVKEDYNIDPELIEGAITTKTKAILPVHWHGCPADMEKINRIAKKYDLHVTEDACMAAGAEIQKRRIGSFGVTGCFSLHPLKPINVWGDGGVITTNNKYLNEKIRLLRNHGLRNRNECEFYAYNSRLDSIQAVVGNCLIKDIDWIISQKIHNAKLYDEGLSKISKITIPSRDINAKHVYHNYVIMAENRDKLFDFLLENSIEAKIHYPVPQHLQKASRYLGYREGDLPKAEYQSNHIISLPVHQYLKEEHIRYVTSKIKEFFR